jgi:two-component system nitrate/nitrite response regulator NarL
MVDWEVMALLSHTSNAAVSSDCLGEIHLLIAGDSQMSCELLKGSLTNPRSLIDVIDCATSQEGVMRSVRASRCDVALISDSLSDGPLTGFQAVRELRHSYPDIRPIMLLKSNYSDLVTDAFRAGAKGVYCRTDPLESLLKCITAVHAGQVWANSVQLNQLLNAFADAAPLRTGDPKRRAPLTKRESDVVKLVVEGLSNREMADQLRLAEQTVSNYLFRIYQKLGISTRVELVLYALKHLKAQEQKRGILS